MTTVMGRFFLGLVWDRVSRQADTPGRVQYRASQLRFVYVASDGPVSSADHRVFHHLASMHCQQKMS